MVSHREGQIQKCEIHVLSLMKTIHQDHFDPIAAANRFLLQFEETYGSHRLDFYMGSYVKVRRGESDERSCEYFQD
jgi:hypothetical protein